MKKILLLFTFLLLFSSILLVSCKDEEPDDSETVIPKGTVVLNVYNWGEYISDGSEGSLDVNKEFTKRYGIKVNYTTFESNETMYSQLKSGGVTYDIVIPSDYMIQRLISEDMLISFDVTELSNYHYIRDDYKNLYFDPKNIYSNSIC